MPLKKRDIIDKFEHKFSFVQVPSTNHEAYAFFYDGKRIASTRFSRGTNSNEVDDPLLNLMSRELRIHQLKFFKEMIQCTKSKEDYIDKLRKGGFID